MTVVRAVRQETDRINVYELMDPDDWELPPYTPGAHIDVHIPGGYVRQYSLCGDPADRNKYIVAVLRESMGTGGSAAFHERVIAGTTLDVSVPRNNFSMSSDAARHIYIAGGIGLTPFMSMVPVLQRQSHNFHLHVCTRQRRDTAFLPQLDQLVNQGLAEFHFDGGDPERGLNVALLLAQPQKGDCVYCCGPVNLMNAVRRATSGWEPGTVRFESFNSVISTPSMSNSDSPPYVVELAHTGRKIPVNAGETMLAALRRSGVNIVSSCEVGNCSTCRVRYLAGDPDHRDFVLSSEERKHFVVTCVSGSRDGKLIVLDL